MKIHPVLTIFGVGIGLWGLSKLLPSPTPAGYVRVPVQDGIFTMKGSSGAQYFYVLPDGGTWLSAVVATAGGIVPIETNSRAHDGLPIVAPAPSVVTLSWGLHSGGGGHMVITYT